ncbi:MAG: flavodoxin family protein [Anaerolineaceae bacterium]
MKIFVIYDSVFGNTEKIAQAIGAAVGAKKDAMVKRVTEVSSEDLQGLDLLLVGSPTRGFRPTEGMAAFLKNLPATVLLGVKAATFDTRIPIDTIRPAIFRSIVKKGGYAAPVIAKVLEAKGAHLIAEPEGFFVKKSEGPLVDGELERAVEWANGIEKST